MSNKEMTREEAKEEIIDMANALQLIPSTPKGKAVSMAIEALEQETDWIPIKTRPMTEEEKEEIGHEYAYMYDCLLPDDGQEVLITDCYGNVEVDTLCRDEEGSYFETNCDDGEVIAWQPKPEPYKAERR